MAKPTSRSRAPIWTRPAPGTRHPKLTREQIADAALAIADTEGFAAVSMRRVAAELGVGTMTLYYYIKTKDDLLALMDDALAAQIVLPADQLPRGWRAAVTAIARISRDAFLRHPWALYALHGARIGPNGIRHIEQSLAAVADAPFDVRGKLRVLSIVDDYVFGHVLRISESATHPVDHKAMKSIAEFLEAQLETGEFPHIEAMVGDKDMHTVFARFAQWMTEDARFEIGLAVLLDGFELRLRGAPPTSASDATSAPDAAHGSAGEPAHTPRRRSAAASTARRRRRSRTE